MSAVGLCNIHHDGWEIEQPRVRTSGPEAAGSRRKPPEAEFHGVTGDTVLMRDRSRAGYSGVKDMVH